MDFKGNELVSVIIPTRNRVNLLKRALCSVVNQTWPEIEIIVIDDCSNDGTLEYLKELSSAKPRIRFVNNKEILGGATSRNIGIELARGKFIAFLDDDDVWLPEKLECQITILINDPLVSAASCWFSIQHESGSEKLVKLPITVEREAILAKNRLGGASMCLTTKHALNSIGGFDPLLKSCQDWDLWIRLTAIGRVGVCCKPLVNYFSHSGIRITTNYESTYYGRRRLYFKYRKEMSSNVSKNLLSELLFNRKVMMIDGLLMQVKGLCRLIKLLGLASSVRYICRFLRLSIFNCLKL